MISIVASSYMIPQTADNMVFMGSFASPNLPSADFTNTDTVIRNSAVSIKKIDANFNVKEVKPWVKISMHI